VKPIGTWYIGIFDKRADLIDGRMARLFPPELWVPRPCGFCKGGQRFCLYYFFGHGTPPSSKPVAQASPTPALRKEREGRGSRQHLCR
jgi:hypothetical protein